MPRGMWAVAVLVLVTGGTLPAAAQPLAPSGPPPEARPSLAFDPIPPAAEPLPVPTSAATTSSLAPPPPVRGLPILGAPVGAASFDPPAAAIAAPAAVPATIQPAGLTDAPTTRSAVLIAPTTATPLPARTFEERPKPPPPPAAGTTDSVNDFLAKRSGHAKPKANKDQEPPDGTTRKSGWKFGEHMEGLFGDRGDRFRRDHAFDGFVSPVTNPFFAEDPRSLTEVRPIFIYQAIPSGQPDLKGGSVTFFGTQARLAVTDRLSFVVNKLGGLSLNPGGSSPIDGEIGFAELWLGPKYTFIRGENTGSLLAGGLQFQLSVGGQGVYQDTGSLSIVPYASYGQNFLRDMRIGSLNSIVTTGYAFSTSNQRSDYLFLTGHLDLDVLNTHRFYPLIELNYFLYTKDGKSNPFGSEGRDLINFGGQAKGNNMLSGAIGGRFKITESAQVGVAYEVPLAGNRDLFRYRFTLDFVLRY